MKHIARSGARGNDFLKSAQPGDCFADRILIFLISNKRKSNMANRHDRRATKKGRSFNLKFEDLHMQADAIFIGLTDHLGEVVAIASPVGRVAIDSIFPNAHVEWRDQRVSDVAKQLPDDWREFNFLVPDLIANRNAILALLPEYLIKLREAEDMSADQFALMMAFAAKEQGIRAAIFSEKRGDIHIVYPGSIVN
jgi:hypothetical protein